MLVALLVCLIPTTIGGLLSAIGIAGMDRMIQANVIAMSGRAVEAAGDVDVLLLDKTGTITMGNRQAVEFIPANGIDLPHLADSAQLSFVGGRNARGPQRRRVGQGKVRPAGATRARSRRDVHSVFGSNSFERRRLERPTRFAKAPLKASSNLSRNKAVRIRLKFVSQWTKSHAKGGTPLVVADGGKTLGVIYLKDIVKGGIKERFHELRQMGIKTVMITGDNPQTAAAIAAEAGVDDFLAEATPEAKLKMIRDYQTGGRLVAMTGDGTNDSPALAQADVAVAMNSGTQAAKEAGNMVDLDSNPTKLIEIVEIGKQLLMTRGSLTTFSLANDVAKYFAIIPAAFATTYPVLEQAERNAAGRHRRARFCRR